MRTFSASLPITCGTEARPQTLVAQCDERAGQQVYRFDIRLQGDGETVFFDI